MLHIIDEYQVRDYWQGEHAKPFKIFANDDGKGFRFHMRMIALKLSLVVTGGIPVQEKNFWKSLQMLQ